MNRQDARAMPDKPVITTLTTTVAVAASRDDGPFAFIENARRQQPVNQLHRMGDMSLCDRDLKSNRASDDNDDNDDDTPIIYNYPFNYDAGACVCAGLADIYATFYVIRIDLLGKWSAATQQ